ncbi:MAG: TMEM14 family protein [Fimbriimonas sp.]
MRWLNAVLGSYAVITIALGLEAFVRVKSVASLAGAGGSGLLVLVGVAVAAKNQAVGYGLCALVALGLIGRFAGPLTQKGQLFPAGLMVALSVLALGSLVAAHFLKPKAA